MDLFESHNSGDNALVRPLADRMRPQTLDAIIGQEHLTANGSLLQQAIEDDRVFSMLLWGPPGCGKTTLAGIIANETKSEFVEISAVLSGVKDIRQIIDQAKKRQALYKKRTILFVDEIHRFNKAQQDAFLHHVEKGLIVLVGATTENPSFEVIPALVSRCRVFTLKSLEQDSVLNILKRALTDSMNGLGLAPDRLTDEALGHIARVSDGDDPYYMLRRMIRFATEDIGLADPGALTMALNASEAFRMLGRPEGEDALFQAAVYLATAPKSNAVYMAHKQVRATVQETGYSPVPMHIRNAPTTLMKNLNYGKGYKYAHDHKNAYVPQSYLPDDLDGQRFYFPTDRGYEKTVKQRLDAWINLKNKADH